MSLSQQRDALFRSPSAEMLSLQVWIPCQVVEHAHSYACRHTQNSVHLLVLLYGCPSGQADRMSLAPRAMRRHKICWPAERGQADPRGKLMRCCDWMNHCIVDKVDCQHIIRVMFKMAFGDSPFYCTKFIERLKIVSVLSWRKVHQHYPWLGSMLVGGRINLEL